MTENGVPDGVQSSRDTQFELLTPYRILQRQREDSEIGTSAPTGLEKIKFVYCNLLKEEFRAIN